MLNTRGIGLAVLVWVLVFVFAVPAVAAPAGGSPRAAVCAIAGAVRPLGVDGGLMGLSRGEFSIGPASRPAGGNPGVDGGLLALLFTRSEVSGPTAQTAVACGSASAGS